MLITKHGKCIRFSEKEVKNSQRDTQGVKGIELKSDDYVVGVLVLVGINIILATSLNLVNGHTGQFSLGHAGFMAVGAYSSSALTLFAGPALLKFFGGPGVVANALLFTTALATAGLCAALAGLVVGIPSLRLRGDYLAIVTLGFGEIIRVVVQNTDVVGGPRGLNMIPGFTNLFWTFGLASVTIYVTSSMVDSTWGRGFLAVRDDEIAAEAMGVNTTRYKVTAFVLGAFFAGIAGALYAHYITYISPGGFDFMKSVDVVVMVILGGMGSTVGVTIAAILLTVLNEFLRSAEQYRMIIFALLLIIMMIVRPQGLLGGLRWPFKGKLRRRKEDHAASAVKLRSSARPSGPDFSGCDWRPWTGGRSTTLTNSVPYSAVPSTASASVGRGANEFAW
jgi:branched-chain amino acid transport system permease protein